jgi:hypothetical protein
MNNENSKNHSSKGGMFYGTRFEAIKMNREAAVKIPVMDNVLFISCTVIDTPFFSRVRGEGLLAYTDAKTLLHFLIDELHKNELIDTFNQVLEDYKKQNS